MKKMFYALNVFIAGAAIMLTNTVNAATYTAVADGDWSSSATWGGTAPGSNPSGDNIIIPAGMTVTLDVDVEFAGGLLFSMNVNGELVSDNDSRLVITSGSLTGNGTIDISSIEVSGLSTLSFTGDLDVDKFRNNVLINLNLGAVVNLGDTLFLSSGSLTLASGSNWTLATDAVILVEGGSILLNGGTMAAGNNYHVLYRGGSVTSGIETTWTGMTDLMIDLDDDTRTLSLGSNTTINGDLKQMSGSLSLNGKDLVLNGDYNNTSTAGLKGSATSRLTISTDAEWTSDLMFETGSQQLDDLTLNLGDDMSLDLVSNLNISGDLKLENGDLNVTNGKELKMENNSNVIVDQGGITTDNGVFNGTSTYNVKYIGSASASGIEMNGNGLNDVTIELEDASGAVTLDANRTINGTLKLNAGMLDLNGNDLTLKGNISTTADGFIMSDNTSSLTINSAVSMTDTLNFASDGHDLDQLNINITSGGSVMIGSDVKVIGLNLNNGSVKIFDNTLELATDGAITGADEDNHVIIDGDGTLKIQIETGGTYTAFPVGTTSGYSPALLQLNSGSTAFYEVNVKNGVKAMGTYGADVALTESMVDRTWDIVASSGATTDIDMKLQWSAAMERNGFNRTQASIRNFNDGTWDNTTASSATTNANGMYELSRDGLTRLNQFAITDGSTVLEIKENSGIIAGVYPNPVDNELNISIDSKVPAQIELIDTYGKVVSSVNTNSAQIVTMDLTALPAGMYYVRANSNNMFTTQKIIKK